MGIRHLAPRSAALCFEERNHLPIGVERYRCGVVIVSSVGPGVGHVLDGVKNDVHTWAQVA